MVFARGEAIIRLKDTVRENGWATPFSGMHFVYAIRKKDARECWNCSPPASRFPPLPAVR